MSTSLQGSYITNVLGALADSRLSFPRGDSFLITIQALLPGSLTPLDLTGASIVFTLTQDPTATPALQLAGVLATDPTTGIATVQIWQRHTANLAVGGYSFDVRATMPSFNDGNEYTLAVGRIDLRQNYT